MFNIRSSLIVAMLLVNFTFPSFLYGYYMLYALYRLHDVDVCNTVDYDIHHVQSADLQNMTVRFMSFPIICVILLICFWSIFGYMFLKNVFQTQTQVHIFCCAFV